MDSIVNDSTNCRIIIDYSMKNIKQIKLSNLLIINGNYLDGFPNHLREVIVKNGEMYK